MKKILDKKGLTLIEVLVSMAISSIVVVMVINFYINFMKIQNKIQEDSVLNSNIVNTINSIKYMIEQKSSVEIVKSEDIIKNKEIVKKYDEYSYIGVKKGKIVVGDFLTKKEPYAFDIGKNNADIQFLKDEHNQYGLTVNIRVFDKNTELKMKPLSTYINLQNICKNGGVIGKTGDVIIYKKDKNI